MQIKLLTGARPRHASRYIDSMEGYDSCGITKATLSCMPGFRC